MADSHYDVLEIRFVIKPDFTEAYVRVQSLDNDCPPNVTGWHYKVFPKDVGTSEIHDRMFGVGVPPGDPDHEHMLFWPLKAPD